MRPLVVVSALCAVVTLSADAQTVRSTVPRALDVHATTIESFDNRDPALRQFGALEFRGGLVLSSSDKEFGELSGIRIAPDGESFITVTDKGLWFRGRLTYRDGRPVGVTEAEIAPMLGPDGKTLASRGWFDTESVADDGDTLYVGIERVNQIVKFNYGRDGLLAHGQPIPLPPEAKALPFNAGFEALVFLRRGQAMGGTLVAISERGLDAAGNIIGFLLGGPSPGTFRVKRIDNFDVTDAAQLPDGDVIILERRFIPTQGISMRLRRIAVRDLRPNALVDGRVLMEADLGYQIDNMEGLAIHKNAAGEVILTMISDDNFNVIQRTILLQFALAEP